MMGNFVLINQRDEIMLVILTKRGFTEMRICLQKGFRRSVKISEITTASPRNPNFFTQLTCMIQQHYLSTTFASLTRTHQTRRTSANHHYIYINHLTPIRATLKSLNPPKRDAGDLPPIPEGPKAGNSSLRLYAV